MPQDWPELLKALGATDNFENFGDLSAELLAARDGTVVAPLEDQALLKAAGPDAADFLHNLLTNDVRSLPPDGARFAGLCTSKGRLIASFLIWREAEDLLVELSADLAAAMLKKLSMYVLRSKVKITDVTGERRLVGLAGPKAGELLAGLGAARPEPMTTVSFPGGQAVRLGEQRYLLALSADNAGEIFSRLAKAARPVGTAAWRWLEISAGQPRIVAATQEAFVPQMVNMELPAVGGVSFHKGCYPGQEVVARTQYLGKIKRRMYRGRLERPFPPGTDVFTPESGDQHCGALVTVAPSPDGAHECLVVVQSSGAEAGEIHVGSPQGPRLALLPMPYTLE